MIISSELIVIKERQYLSRFSWGNNSKHSKKKKNIFGKKNCAECYCPIRQNIFSRLIIDIDQEIHFINIVYFATNKTAA